MPTERGETSAPTQKQENKIKMSGPNVEIIKPAEGKTYAEIFAEIKQKVKPEETKTSIKATRQT